MEQVCSKCNGEKKITVELPIFIQNFLDGFIGRKVTIRCPECKGKGYITTKS